MSGCSGDAKTQCIVEETAALDEMKRETGTQAQNEDEARP